MGNSVFFVVGGVRGRFFSMSDVFMWGKNKAISDDVNELTMFVSKTAVSPKLSICFIIPIFLNFFKQL